jgi:hypothetical protein
MSVKKPHAEIFWNNAYVNQGKSQRSIFIFAVSMVMVCSIVGWADIIK